MNKWLQIDAEQNEEWLRKQGTGTYIDLSTIKKRRYARTSHP